jgi:hypothetical protein
VTNRYIQTGRDGIRKLTAVLTLALVAFSGNGSFGSLTGQAEIYCHVLGKPAFVYRADANAVETSVSDDLVEAATGGPDGLVAALCQGSKIRIFKAGHATPHIISDVDRIICWSRGRLLYSSGGKILGYDPGTKSVKVIAKEDGVLSSLAWNGDTVWTTWDAHQLIIERRREDQVIKTWKVPTTDGGRILLSRNRYIVVQARDRDTNQLSVIDLITGKLLPVLRYQTGLGVSLDARGRILLCRGEYNKTTRKHRSGLCNRSILVSIDPATGKAEKLVTLSGQAELCGPDRALGDVLVLRALDVHGPGDLLKVDHASGRTKLIRKNVWRCFVFDNRKN